MARSNGKRIVLEVDVELKRALYALLNSQGVTLKAWFTRQAGEYLLAQKEPVQLTIGSLMPKNRL